MAKKVLIVGMSKNYGGVETFIYNMYRYMDKRQFECYFITGDDTISYQKEILDLGGRIIKTTVSRHNPIQYYRYYTNLFKMYRFDMLLYNTCDIIAIDMLRFAKKANVPVRVIHSHNSEYMRHWGTIHKIEEKISKRDLAKCATHFLACSEDAGKWMFGGIPFKVIRNGIKTKTFRYNADIRTKLRNQYDLNDEFVIGTVGRLQYQKNPEFIIDILNEVLKINNNAHLIMIGIGELETVVKEKIHNMGLDDSVSMLGRRTDVADWLQAFDCFLMPSRFEGFPIALVEAQAAGLPCITTKGTVPDSTNITGCVKFVDLDKPARDWAEVVSRTYDINIDRGTIAEKVRAAGYDIEDAAREYEQFLLNALEENERKNI